MSEAGGNPVLVEVSRSRIVESRHTGAIAIADTDGCLLVSLGDVTRSVYPRSAVKPLQAIPLIESGAADVLGISNRELAVACSSHSGDSIHVAAVRSLLAKAGLKETSLACGAHWPVSERATRELLRADAAAQPIHNNCSGKHAAMLATAVHCGLETRGYGLPSHQVQVAIQRVLSETCGIELDQNAMGIDGCSVPAFAMPLAALAHGFAWFGSGEGLAPARADAAKRLMQACYAEPVLIAGQDRFDTIVARDLVGVVFAKGGAEGVHCAALPELGLGIAVKIDDGAKRAVERALSEVLAAFLPEARRVLADQLEGELHNWRGLSVGRIESSADLRRGLKRLN
jgi:L-asparaginase II